MSLKVFWAAVIGTVLEYFDFLLFAHFSLIIAPLFFPDIDPIVAALQALGLFAAGFVMRPLGAIIFGWIGDYQGRRYALSASVLCAALPTFIICFLPPYNVIGIAAPIILILCRMAQGFSLGGEYINAGILLMEHSPLEKRGFYSSILCASASVGCILALSCAFAVLYTDMPSWTWRVPFFLGSIAGLIGYKMRKILIESPEFETFQKHHSTDLVFSWKQILADKKPFFIIMSIAALVGTLIWTPVTYTNFYLTKILEWQARDAIFMTLVANVTFAMAAFIAGTICERIGAQTIMFTTTIIAALLSYPLFLCLTCGYVITAQIGFTTLAAFFTSPIHRIMVDLFPVRRRCRAISFAFSLGAAIFGGTSPVIAAWLVDLTNNHTSPALYVSAISLMTAWALYLYPTVKSHKKNSILITPRRTLNQP